MRTMLRGKVTLLFLTFAVATLIFPAIAFAQDAATSTAAPTTSTAAPTIQSDKDDYQPGELVTLTGSDWQPGDSVHIFVNDDEGQSWSHNSDPDPVADDSGAFTYEFNLPEQFVAMYNVTATGVESGTAKTTFTDAVAFGGCPAGSPISSPINVTTTNDEYNTTPNSTCSLREAIRAASLDPGADTINVPAGTYTLFRNGSDNTTSGIDQKDLDITNGPVTIKGASARTTIIQAGTSTALGIDRVLDVQSGLTLQDVTVRNGLVSSDGGGIRNLGTLSLTDVTVSGNYATSDNDGGGIYTKAGGDTLTVNRATISENRAGDEGGGIYSEDNGSLTNVTLTNNTAADDGGGFKQNSDYTFTFTNVTVSNNTAGFGSDGFGGGIRRSSGTVWLRNTLLTNNTADSTSGSNCSGGVTNIANNLDSGTSCAFGSVRGSKSSANANLGALQNNGGPTDTRELLSGSAAIDAGVATFTFTTPTSAPNVDQRSVSRPQGSAYDIGAFERVPPVTTFELTVAKAGTGTGTVTSDPAGITCGVDCSQIYNSGASVTLTANADNGSTFDPQTGWSGAGTTNPDGTRTVTMSEARSVTATFNIANSAPVAKDDSYSVNEDGTLTANGAGTNPNGVLFNDTDADNNSLTASLVNNVSHGSLTLNSNGTFTYTPNDNYNGSDTFTYKANDVPADSNVATVTINVTAVDDSPVAVNDTKTVFEDDAATAIDVLNNDTDVDAGPKTIASVTQPTNGTVVLTGGTAGAHTGLTYKPNANYCNTGSPTDTFTYTLNGGSTATVAVTVTCVDDLPVAVNDTATVLEDANATTIDVLANDTDVDGGSKTVASVTQPANGTVAITAGGTGLTYKPNRNYCNGGSPTDNFTYKLNGGSEATVAVTVTCVDDNPVAVFDSKTVAEDDAATAIDVLNNDTDVDGGPKTISSASDPANGTVVLTGGSPGAHTGLTYKPDPNYCNDPPATNLDTFTYTLNGGSEATVAMTVTCVNDAPVAKDDSYSTDEDTPLIVAAPGVLGNDTDEEGNSLTAVLVVSGPAHGTLTQNANGSFSYTPNANYNGSDSFTYKANDGTANSNVATVSITVTAVNDAPGVSNNKGSQSVQYSDPIAPVTISASDVDTAGSSLQATTQFKKDAGAFSSGLPSDLSLAVASTSANERTWTLSGNANVAPGTYVVRVNVSDGVLTRYTDVTIIVAKEDATLGFTGPYFAPTASATATSTSVTLNALVTQAADGNLGDLRNAKVQFLIYKGSNLTMTAPDYTCGTDLNPVLVNESGVATCQMGVQPNTIPLGLDSFTVVVRFTSGSYFTGPNSDAGVLTVYQPSADKFLTGGGWIVDPSTGNIPVAISAANNHGNFGFTVRYKKGSMTEPQGQSVYVFRGANGYNYIIKSNAWQGGALAFPSLTTAGFSGKANVTVINPATGLPVTGLGGGNYSFRVDTTDNGSPGTTDKYAISIYTPTGALYHQAGTTASQILLGGGNLVIHTK